MRATMMAMATPAPLLPGDPRWLGAYELVGRIGQGGQGTVFLGRKPGGDPVAIKLLHAEWTREPTARARFAREVAAAERVAPFCTARILDARLEGDEPFVVSEYIDGPSLHDVVTADGPLTGPALDRLAVGTATALSAIHQAGVIHRDFKPGNVLMGPDGPRVIDFGIARSVDATTTVTGQLFGTPGYMAPEVVRGQPAGAPGDVFAWAATITFAATGASPFHAPNVAAVVHRLTQGEPDLGALSGPLRGIVAGCLAKDPAARPAALDLLVRLLQTSGPGGPVPGLATIQAAPGLPRPARAERVMAVGGGVAGQADVLSPPRQQAPAAWPTDRMAADGLAPGPGPAPGYAPAPGHAPGGPGWRPGPAPRPGPGGHRAALWVVIAGVVALGIVGLLLPALLTGHPITSTPGPQSSPASSASTPPAAPADAIPLRFAGTWRGRADQPGGVVSRWAAVLRLPAGATSGTFTITTMPCYATVSVVDVGRAVLVLRETAGPGSAATCAASGYITLDRTGLNRAVLHWQDASDRSNRATGVFARA
jgi:predicted Ser/Thr protein kinase